MAPEARPARSHRAPRASPASPGAPVPGADTAPHGAADSPPGPHLRVPPTPETFVSRTRLSRRLTEAIRHPLTLVSGPAGAGKTLAVADWARSGQAGMPVAWLTVDADDTDPRVFWAHLAEAVHTKVSAPADPADTAADLDRSPSRRLAAELSAPRPIAVVLDDFDGADDPQVAAGLHDLLRYAGDGLRLVLVGRTDPVLPLHRYRASGDVAEIRAADLAFTPEETAVLMRRHGLDLSDDGVRALAERTEGWAAGLRLCALAATRSTDPETYLKEFEAGHSVVADFLLAEVLDAQPPEVQDLLLRTSILERTHPDLADALTGGSDAGRVLDELARANAFVTPADGAWYRHSPIFAEILRVHLRARAPGLTERLHEKAGRWLHREGHLDEALRHAAAAGRWDLAATWLVDDLGVTRLLADPGSGQLAALFDTMPPSAPGEDAELIRAARALAAHDVEAGLGHLERAAAAAGTDPHSAESGGAAEPGTAAAVRRLEHACLSAVAGRMAGTTDLAEEAARATDRPTAHVPDAPAELRARQHEVAALLLNELGASRLWEGRITAARDALYGAADEARGAERTAARHESVSLLALADLLGGAPGRAETRARQALAEVEREHVPPTDRCGIAYLVLADVAAEHDEITEAERYLARFEALTGGGDADGGAHDPLEALVLATLRSKLALCKGDPHGALAAVADSELPTGVDHASRWATRRAALAASAALLGQGDAAAALDVLSAGTGSEAERAVAHARAHLASGDAPEALRALTGVPASTAAPAIAVRVLLGRAEATELSGDHDAAQHLLARAFTVARPDVLRRPIVDAGPWLRRLVRRRPGLVADHAWLPEDVRASGATPGGGADPASGDQAPVEPLSGREQEVLGLAAEMRSTEEIAADLHLSVNTVKTHLKSIHRKLNVTRRAEAVRRARRLGML
ncbi:LuxR C-terminal-related transcriptional regulator [Yinghuangia seranimata]|uniref:LuxR C-terminal-related transcriptional regulator n=1 Tax=Yinghuangia seranimata TaxID=408067 RepID=UPI00248AE3D8|nr:LuxR C-terminal-related transcriptional regulator [Yinghuangia seranimata]MDI2126520.1 LuxR C-terminal-related transcriptional regulator [Yinghuangia seranimata]